MHTVRLLAVAMRSACWRASAAIVLALAMLAACWRGSAAMEPAQPSFIARRNALIELRRSANALSPKVELVAQRIIGLSSELERAAIRDDLVELAREVAELSRYSLDARSRGESPMLLDAVDRDLERTALVLVNLRDELRYAKTTAELAARDELERDTSADEQPAIRFRRLIEVLPPVQLPAPRRPAPPAELP